MFTHKQNVNILTQQLVAYGINTAVICPGSRNAPIIHNLNECASIRCFPVTDERSAGFYALGLSLAAQRPVVVCVTSGTALLNLLPAVAEAWYRQIPLIVVSADRPQAWIDQQDGQTLPQADALHGFVKKAVSLAEPHDEETTWHCHRLIDECLQEQLRHDNRFPIHINVHISEPLFDFTVSRLPATKPVVRANRSFNREAIRQTLIARLLQARRPIIIVGQTAPGACQEATALRVRQNFVVLHEQLADLPHPTHFEEIIRQTETSPALQSSFFPDFIIYIGGTLVSKPLKKMLRKAHAPTWIVNPDGTLYDTFMNLEGIVECDCPTAFQELAGIAAEALSPQATSYRQLWDEALDMADRHNATFIPTYSQLAAVRCLEENNHAATHYANSSAIRLANIFARKYVYCNRGVNGIDGSLSTAAGFSLHDTSEKTVCVIGDLSFFYDQNALWNRMIGGNLRILLLNNGGGGIFHQLNGVKESAAFQTFIAAEHHASAEGICRQNNILYLSANDMPSMQEGISHLLSVEASRPVLLEVFTTPEQDAAALNAYFSTPLPLSSLQQNV